MPPWYGGIAAGDERDTLSPGPMLVYTRCDTVNIRPPNPSQPGLKEFMSRVDKYINVFFSPSYLARA